MGFFCEEVRSILNRSIALKSGVDRMKCPLIGKSIGLFFEKPSTRHGFRLKLASINLARSRSCSAPGSFSWGVVKRLQIQPEHCPGICMGW